AAKKPAERDLAHVDRIEAGSGGLTSLGGKPVAAYRDPGGDLHLMSAACTHAGCTVHWNSFEGCWDCPCHGSQFGARGEVLHAPGQSHSIQTNAVVGAEKPVHAKKEHRHSGQA